MIYKQDIPDKNFVDGFVTFFYKNYENKILPLTVLQQLDLNEIKVVAHDIIKTYGDVVSLYIHTKHHPRILDLHSLTKSFHEPISFSYKKTYATLCHRINLKCKNDLVKFVRENNSLNRISCVFSLDPRIKNLLDEELSDRGLSKTLKPIIFNKLKTDEFTHVDAYGGYERIQKVFDTEPQQKLCNASIIVPISGCENTEMFWQSGNYELITVKYYNSFHTSPIENILIKWYDEPKKIFSTCIKDDVNVCVTDIPHGVSVVDGTIRTTLTFRLWENESFDEIVEKLS